MNQANILQNGEFLGETYAYRNDETLSIAVGWAPWWLNNRPGMPQWQNQQPRYLKKEIDGMLVQSLATPYGTHVAGLFQQVPAAPGNHYELTVSVQAWSSEGETHGKSKDAGDFECRIGIDPSGGLDPNSPLPVGRFRRNRTIVGPGDTHIVLEPENPIPDEPLTIMVSAIRNHPYMDMIAYRPDGEPTTFIPLVANNPADLESWLNTWSPDEKKPAEERNRSIYDGG